MASVRKTAPAWTSMSRQFVLSSLMLLIVSGNAHAANNVWDNTKGPPSAVTNTIAFAGDAVTLVAGSNGGGIFRSVDDGVTWTAANNGISSSAVVTTIVRSGTDLFTGTNGSGVYASSDTVTWLPVSSGLPANSNVSALSVNGTDIYAGINGGGVYKSINNGTTWTAINGGSGLNPLTTATIRSINVIPTTPPTILAGTTSAGLFASTDDGTNWNSTTGLPIGATIMAVACESTTICYAGTKGQGVYKSTDGGQTWSSPANNGLPANTVVNAFKLRDSSTSLYALTDGGIYRTDDKAVNWMSLNTGLGTSSCYTLAIAPSPMIMYVGTSGGIYSTVDSGTSWALSNTGLSYVTDIRATAISVDPLKPNLIFAGGGGSGAFKSTDSGASWMIANSGLGNSTVNALLSRTTALYAGTNNGVYKSTDDAATWTAINTGLPLVNVRTLAFNSATLFAGTNNGVYKTADGLINWTATGPLGNPDVRAITIDSSSSAIYVGTAGGGVFKSSDGGDSWSAVNTNLSNTVVQAMTAVSQPQVFIYAGTADRLFYTPNSGGSWLPLGNFTVSDIRSVAVSGNDSTIIAAGTNTDGVYLSSSSGTSWLQLNNGLPTNPVVQSLAISSGSPRKMFAGLAGKGVATVTLTPTILVTEDVEPTPSTALTSIDYGTVFKDTTVSETIKISNTGSLTLNVTAITLTHIQPPDPQDPPVFTWKPAGSRPCPSSAPFSIQPGSNCTLDIDVSPTTTEMITGTVTIVSNDANHLISLQAKSIDLSASIDSPGPIDHGDGIYAYIGGDTVTIGGTASAVGTTLDKVQISTNGGSTWNDADGTNNWSYSWNLSEIPAIPDGDYMIRVRAVDMNNFSSSPDCSNVTAPFDCVAVKVNNIPPVSAITSPTNNAKLVGGPRTITGTASSAGAMVDRVEVSTDGGSTWGTARGTTTWTFDWEPLTSGTYIIQSRAPDKDNKIQDPPYPTVTVIIDSVLPGSAITSPADNAIITGTSLTMSGTASDTGGSDLARVDISLDGEATWQAASGLSNWTYVWAIPPNTYADYFIKSRAVDGAGNIQAPVTSIKITVDNIKPTSTINNIPVYLTGTNYTFTGEAADTGVGVSKVEVSINGGAWIVATFDSVTGTWSYPWTLPADGTYTVAARAVDGINNIQSTPATVTAVVNNGAPAVAIAEPADNAAIKTSTYTISGTAADVGAGINRVEISIDGGAWNAATFNQATGGWSYLWTIPSLEKSYTIQAKATDNDNDSTTTAVITVIYDISAPSSSIVLPGAGANLNGTSYTITGTAIDPVSPSGQRSELQAVQVSFDGGATWYPATATTVDWTTWSYNWILPLSETHLTIKSRAIDKAGNIQTLPFAAAVNVYQVPPTSAISVPANGAFLNGSSRTITGTATDLGLGIQHVEISTNGGVTWDLAGGAETWSYIWQLPQDGVYTLMTKATDIVGYVETSPVSISVTVDNTLPDTNIASMPPLYSNSTAPSFTFTASEPATFECKLDGSGYAPCGSPYSYSGLADGSHTFTVRAIDRATNIDTSPASYTWTVDTVQPQASGASPVDAATRISVASPVTVTFSEAMDPATINTSTFTLDNGTTGTVTYNPSTNVATFAATPRLQYAATYTATITNGAKDLAGNSLAAPFVWTFSTDPDGDINHDGSVDIADAVYCLRAVVRGTALTAEQIRHGNVAPLNNGKPLPNDSVDIGDAVVILERVVGLSVW